ncbi:MAG: PTS sugar transporter subunit IIA, partial [Planctomycetota bacterium]|nr:PTS sugar transporter subunit IIA [Planctomycetota bacterium]
IKLELTSGLLTTMDPEKDPERERVRLKEEVIAELVDLFMATGQIRNRNKFHHDLLSRERKASTAIGNGIALPHVRSLQPRGVAVIFARSRAGVEYLALDGAPVKIFFGIAAPSYDDRVFLQFYKWIAQRFLEEEWLPQALLEAMDENEIIRTLSALR